MMPNHLQKPGRARANLISTVLGALAALGTLCFAPAAHAQSPYIGEVICGGWNFCPSGWGECNGQLVPIAENDTLFSLIGTTYGGDGQTTFALPNIQGRTMVGQGQGPGLSNKVIGGTGGTETVTLTANQMPGHTHAMAANTATEKAASPTGRIMGTAPVGAAVFSSSAPNATLSASAVSTVGGSQPHNNLQPYLAVKCCISLFGVYPSQN